MKKSTLFLLGIVFSSFLFSQISFSDVNVYSWNGTGKNQLMMIIDFNDSLETESFAFGINFDTDSISGIDILEIIAQNDTNFSYSADGWLQTINFFDGFETHTSLDTGWFSIWESTVGGENWATNTGIGDYAKNQGWFGISYLYANGMFPGDVPQIPLLPQYSVSWNNINYWVGSGNNQAIFVVDFHDSSATEAYAWGYRFDDETTGEEMLLAIAEADNNITIDTAISEFGSYLNDIIYNSQEGIGGSPNYWSTWSRYDSTIWTMNAGLSTIVNNGSWFGCSYTDFAPPVEPGNPVSASNTNSIDNISEQNIAVYPNPCSEWLSVSGIKASSQLLITGLEGKTVKEIEMSSEDEIVNISDLDKGIYIMNISNKTAIFSKKLIVQ